MYKPCLLELTNQLSNDNNYIYLFGYSKTPECQSGIKTGKSLILNNIDNLCVIDFNFNDNNQNIYNFIYDILPKDNAIIIKTPHDGLHIYCYNNVDYLFT